MTDFNCPNCGAGLAPALDIVKMMSCGSCGTSVFLANDGARLAGERGVMHEAPLLFGLGDTLRMGRKRIEVLGHARYSYGRGFWDEFWGVTQSGDPVWVSVDEGDIVMQFPLPDRTGPVPSGKIALGTTVNWDGETFRITEVETAECIALAGSFGEELVMGETYQFCNAADQNGRLLSGEFWAGGATWYLGDWLDPFEIKVESTT